jgi:hypothetical protein
MPSNLINNLERHEERSRTAVRAPPPYFVPDTSGFSSGLLILALFNYILREARYIVSYSDVE